MVASLVIFLPGAALTTSVLELAAGQMVSGASRLVSGGDAAGVARLRDPGRDRGGRCPAVGVCLSRSADLLGAWSPWLGVLVFAVGVVARLLGASAVFPGFLVVLYAAWVGQVLGNAAFGGYVSAFVGAAVMTPWPPSSPPAFARRPAHPRLPPCPGSGSSSLVRSASSASLELARGSGGEDLVATVGSIFGVAVGVLFGTLLLASASATGKVVNKVSAPLLEQHPTLRRWRTRAEPTEGDGAEADGR